VGGLWQALTLPFFGKYDDYGSVKDVEEGTGAPINRVVLGKSVTDVLRIAREMRKPPRMNLRGYWGETDLRLMMVHSEVWQLLTSECRTPRGDQTDAHAEAERIPEFLEFARNMSAEFAGYPVFGVDRRIRFLP